MFRLNAKQLRLGIEKEKREAVPRNEIFIILDNVVDTYNIGAIFRLADAVAAKKVYLCGATATPPNPRIKKASINTTEYVDWEYVSNPVDALNKLKKEVEGIQLVAIEQTSSSVPFHKFKYHLPLGLIVGNESYGVSAEVLEMSDGIVEIPMFGINRSLNVMVALGIVMYQALVQTVLGSH